MMLTSFRIDDEQVKRKFNSMCAEHDLSMGEGLNLLMVEVTTTPAIKAKFKQRAEELRLSKQLKTVKGEKK